MKHRNPLPYRSTFVMPSNNLCILAAAGSRKTTHIIDQALSADPSTRILITTYTNQNVDELRGGFLRRVGVVPSNITITSWFSFILQDGIRPYQRSVTDLPRVVSFNYTALGVRKISPKNIDHYFFDSVPNIYSEVASEFVVSANRETVGKVIHRMEGMYDAVLIDEVQDLAGWDLELLDLLMRSSIEIMAVGDPRQATFSTNRSNKNRQYRGARIAEWFQKQERSGLCRIEQRTASYRCNQAICDFADALYPHLSKTISKNYDKTGHDGVFCIPKSRVASYIEEFHPTLLKYSRTTKTMGYAALNIGVSKGQTYDRVLIFPTTPMKRYLKTRIPADAGDPAKLYIAVTRARYSAAFVV